MKYEYEYVTQFPFNNESCHIIVQIKQFVNITKDLILEPRLPARDPAILHSLRLSSVLLLPIQFPAAAAQPSSASSTNVNKLFKEMFTVILEFWLLPFIENLLKNHWK